MAELTYETVGPADEVDDLARMLSLAFGFTPDDCAKWLERAGRRRLRKVRRDGETVAGTVLIEMGLFLGGRSVPQVGVAGVGVMPEARGAGIARRLMVESLREMRAEGAAVSTLYSALHQLYRAVGYDDAGFHYTMQVPAGMIESGDRGDGWRAATEADTAAMAECYNTRARVANGFLDRGDYMWQRVFRPRGERAEVFVAEDEDNRVEAACAYRLQPWDREDLRVGSGAGQVMACTELSWATPRGLDRLLGFLRGFSSVVGEIRFSGEPASPLLLALPDRRYRARILDRWMLRIVDVRRALEARGYPPFLSAELHLEVDDPLLTENTGRWLLRVEQGQATAEPGGEGHLHAPVRSLASMYTGFISASQMRLAGLIDATDDAVAAADALFGASRPPCMVDTF